MIKKQQIFSDLLLPGVALFSPVSFPDFLLCLSAGSEKGGMHQRQVGISTVGTAHLPDADWLNRVFYSASSSKSFSISFITLAGTPPAIQLSGISFVTTAPAAMTTLFQIRITAAQNMLRYSEYSYAEISTILAYSSQSHFTKVFRGETGYTSKEYRQKFYRAGYWKK